MTFDNFGRLETLTNPLSTFTYSYAPHTSMLTGVSSPGGGDTLFTYKGVEEDFRLESIENLDPSAAALSKFHYAQDAIGRITDWVQQEAAGTSETYAAKYDKSSRLTEWAQSNPSDGKKRQWNWRFDSAGNRLSQQLNKVLNGLVAREEYTVNEADQIIDIKDGGPLHVSGILDEQGKISTGLSPAPVLTEANNSFGNLATGGAAATS